MDRREFVTTAGAALALPLVDFASNAQESSKAPHVITVTGKVAAHELGTMLPHEHVMVDFIGADKVSPARYDADEVFKVMLPYVPSLL